MKNLGNQYFLSLVLFSGNIGGCTQSPAEDLGTPLSAYEKELIAASRVLEFASPGTEASLFNLEDQYLEVKTELFQCGGNLVRDERLLILRFPLGWEDQNGPGPFVSPFEDWVRERGLQRAWHWNDGAEASFWVYEEGSLFFYGEEDVTDAVLGPFPVELLTAEIRVYDE